MNQSFAAGPSGVSASGCQTRIYHPSLWESISSPHTFQTSRISPQHTATNKSYFVYFEGTGSRGTAAEREVLSCVSFSDWFDLTGVDQAGLCWLGAIWQMDRYNYIIYVWKNVWSIQTYCKKRNVTFSSHMKTYNFDAYVDIIVFICKSVTFLYLWNSYINIYMCFTCISIYIISVWLVEGHVWFSLIQLFIHGSTQPVSWSMFIKKKTLDCDMH